MHPSSRRLFLDSESDQNAWGIIDILTLTLVFFIILYVNEMGTSTVRTAALLPAKQDTSLAAEPIIPELGRSRRETLGGVRKYFAGVLGNGFYIKKKPDNVTLVLEERVSFNSGEDTLSPAVLPILDRVSSLLRDRRDVTAVISGYTDDVPINNNKFRSNWHLSAARAATVAEYLIAKGVSGRRLSIRGYAQYRPLYPNDSPEHRSRNRRVEIALRPLARARAL